MLLLSLASLEIDLMKEYLRTEEINLKKEWLNNLISKIKDELRFRTSSTVPEDVDFYRILIENEKIKNHCGYPDERYFKKYVKRTTSKTSRDF